MCNITAWWSRERKPTVSQLKSFFKYGEVRGTDGVGLATVKRNISTGDIYVDFLLKNKNTKKVNEWLELLKGNIGDILLCNFRSTPETEPEVEDNNTIQPINHKDNNIILVHNGAISNFIVKEMEEDSYYHRYSKLDSESIIWSYLKHGKDIVEALEYISGGFSLIMLDMEIKKLIVACSHNPLYCGYVTGAGMFWNSQEEAIWDAISNLKGTKISRHNLNVFEDYYCREIKEHTIEVIDIPSGSINEFQFNPRYKTSTFDTYIIPKKSKRKKVLVAASGGLDSTTTLVTLKSANYDPIAIYFNYGHRGGTSEYLAIKKITNILNIDLVTFDISIEMRNLDQGMLTDKRSNIITGTDLGLKTTAAWTTWRNGFFLSYMAAYAESVVMKENLKEIYLTGGFMNLTESGVYPDNTERFLKSFLKFNKFASIVGNRIHPLYGLCNILKTEQYILLNSLGYYNKLGPLLISCDRPKVISGEPKNCSKDSKPACGSGLLAWWACKMAGLVDNRNYYEVDDKNYQAYTPNSNNNVKNTSIIQILNKLSIHRSNLELLKKKLKG